MAQAVSNTHDEVLYPSRSFSQTHPDRLATLATLFGMSPASVENCRVLELGCGAGGNLIPMAFGLPYSSFVGIDLAARPIAKGQTMIQALGLKNVQLVQLDLMDVTTDFGEFDYIIAHGLYSWVHQAVRDKLLAVCGANLAPHGVAYVSYLTFPGAHLVMMLREMMLFHVRDFAASKQRLDEARALLKFLVDSQPENNDYGTFLKKEMELLTEKVDGFLYHDELEEVYAPVYFYQFMEHAARHGMEYLGDVDFVQMQPNFFPPETCEMLRLLAQNSLIRKEQYLDFLKCTRFRQTLLCHEGIRLDRSLKPEMASLFYVGTDLRPISKATAVASNAEEEFQSPYGAAMLTDEPLVKAAFLHMSDIWPRSIRVDQLMAEIRPSMPLGTAAEDRLILCEALLVAYGANLIEMRTHLPQFVTEVSERPIASPVARWQIQYDDSVSTLCHKRIHLTDPLARHLLLLLDGTRDRVALLTEISLLIQSGTLRVEQAAEKQNTIESLLSIVEERLKRLANLPLLIA